ncbi:hypothetical protein AGMMS50276_18160 [Synergistales bacterium]|nr:hypothetical protein AGMMS50276_18160 [Synergistales bacterium]
MITQLKLNNIATFTDVADMRPRKINFCYGDNGSGKTAISNVIADCPQSGATINWELDPLQTLVYNTDFVADNFSETSKIDGVFTIGEDSKEAQEFINEQRAKADECGRSLEVFNRTKEKLISKRGTLETELKEDCWRIKKQYEQVFAEAFSSLGKKDKLKAKCLSEAKSARLPNFPVTELKRQYGIAFGQARPIYQGYAMVDVIQITDQEKCDLLAQRISGSSETPIGKFIEYLGSSDWVKQGLRFADKADCKCPFCQRDLPHDTYNDIKAFFDDSYERDLAQLKVFYGSYSRMTETILVQLRGYMKSALPILDYALFKSEVDALALLIGKNIRTIESKVNSPSVEVGIDSLLLALERINEILGGFNSKIAESNYVARNQNAQRQECVDNVRQLVFYEAKGAVDRYNKEIDNNFNAIKRLEEQIKTLSSQQREYYRLISEKEKTLTSVKPTVEAINDILARFGFEGFSVAENPREAGTYKIVRADGKCVDRTLSEGEHNLISFLYFYHLVYGSRHKTGIAQSKVIVIDDPVSGLDSNAFSIVSKLTKQIIDDCLNDKEGIKQVFVLTHNARFHNEVALSESDAQENNKTAFWAIRKNNNVSRIVSHGDKNPVQALTGESEYKISNAEYYMPRSTERASSPARKAVAKNINELTDGVSDELFERLRVLRSNLARAEGVPAFVVFHDATLRSMCELLPENDAEFRSISGVGPNNFKKYGEIFLREIQEWKSGRETTDLERPTPNLTEHTQNIKHDIGEPVDEKFDELFEQFQRWNKATTKP